MSRYIDAENIEFFASSPWKAIATKSSIDNIPTADVQEVKHGEWVPSEYQPHHICSICGHWFSLYDKVNYCPNCGAKMDLNKE